MPTVGTSTSAAADVEAISNKQPQSPVKQLYLLDQSFGQEIDELKLSEVDTKAREIFKSTLWEMLFKNGNTRYYELYTGATFVTHKTF